MCVSDFRLARQVLAVFRGQYNTTGPVNTTFLPNPQRVGLLVKPDSVVLGVTAGLIVTFDNGSVIILATAGGLNLLKIEDIGQLVQRGFVLTAITTQHTGTVTEFILPESVLAAPQEEFRRNY